MRIAYIGNFEPRHSTENHVRLSLEHLGHEVLRVQENRTSMDQLELLLPQADLVLYTRTWGLPGAPMLDLWQRLKERDIPTVSYHLDLYRGLARTDLYERLAPLGITSPADDPFWRTEFCFTVDGDPDSALWFQEQGINHYWMRAGVYHAECYRVAVPERYPVLFCGSYGYHKEWCVDEETEILTQRGWLRYSDVTVQDQAYSMDPKTGEGCWSRITAVNSWPAEPRRMVLMENPRHSSLTTPDHRWLVQHRTMRTEDRGLNCPDCAFVASSISGVSNHRRLKHGLASGLQAKDADVWDFFTTSELKSNMRIPLAAQCRDLPKLPVHQDSFVELVAWAWTEGHVHGSRFMAVYQSHAVNPEFTNRIRQCLQVLYGPPVDRIQRADKRPQWREVSYRKGLTQFSLNKTISDQLWNVCPQRVVSPEFVCRLTRQQLEIFVQTSLDADGHQESGKYHHATIQQKNPLQLDAFTMACALLGKATNTTTTAYPGRTTMTTVSVKNKIFTNPHKARKKSGKTRIEEVIHFGRIWCPTTTTGTWLARRNGTVYFTGNSYRPQLIDFLSATYGNQFTLLPGNDRPAVRNHDLNEAYGASRVVVGDTLCPGFKHKAYASDRIYETLGRGGFIIHPWIEGQFEDELEHGKHCIFYKYGDFDELQDLIDYYLHAHTERETIRAAGHERVKEKCTYVHRMAAILETVCAK